ncbi:MAG: rod-binding protein [Treponema sp.]|jgi:flagellar protein FlgJ|nr:rod-binding protein [Treponema sp.]
MAIEGIGGGVGALTGSYQAAQSARVQQEAGVFQGLLDAARAEGVGTASRSGRLPGDYTSGFAGAFTGQADKHAVPGGAAQGSIRGQTIDKTSALYEKSLELESFFVKTMLSAMRNSVVKTNLGGEENSFARDMYEGMFYDELAVSLTKNAGFGLADQIYLELDQFA